MHTCSTSILISYNNSKSSNLTLGREVQFGGRCFYAHIKFAHLSFAHIEFAHIEFAHIVVAHIVTCESISNCTQINKYYVITSNLFVRMYILNVQVPVKSIRTQRKST